MENEVKAEKNREKREKVAIEILSKLEHLDLSLDFKQRLVINVWKRMGIYEN